MMVAPGAAFVEDSRSVLLPVVVLAHVVGIHAAGADRAQLSAAIEGCNQALGADRCRAQTIESAKPSWVAELRWLDDERRQAHVRLTRSDERGVEVVTRDVEFDADDPLEHRYRALGLIVAAYVIASGVEGAQSPMGAPDDAARGAAPGDVSDGDVPDGPGNSHQGAGAAEGAARSAPRSDRRSAAHAAPGPSAASTGPTTEPSAGPAADAVGPDEGRGCARTTESWGFDVAVVGNPAADVPLPRLGAAARPWWRFCDRPLFALGQVRWSRSEAQGLQVDFLSASLGLGVHLPAAALPVALELRTELVGERATLRAEERTPDRSEQAHAWRLGARAGADVVVNVVGGWSLFVGGELSLLRPRLVVEVAGEPVGREPWLGVNGLAGLRWQLLR